MFVVLQLILKTLAAVIILIAFRILVYPYLVEDLSYRIRYWNFRRKNIKVGFPYTRYEFPFGIPFFIFFKRASKEGRLFQRVIDRNVENERRLTIRQEGVGMFNFFTIDPENLKAIMSTQFKEFGFGARYKAFFPLLGNGIFTTDDYQVWSHSRAMLRPQFTRQQISHLANIDRHCNVLLEIIMQRGTKEGQYVDLQPLFHKFTIDTATEFLFGESLNSLNLEDSDVTNVDDFGKALDECQSWMISRVRAGHFSNFIDSPKFHDAIKICKDLADKYVNKALERYKKRKEAKNHDDETKSYIFLDELAKETQNPVQLRDQVLNLLVAGRDTTASLLSWTFYNLALHKDVFYKLRKNVLETYGTDTDSISFESLKRCVYLRHVINETLRLYPIVPGNQRTAKVDTFLPHGGNDPSKGALDESLPVFIPKGTQVNFSVFVLQRHPKFWGEDANKFIPERWIDKEGKHPWDFLPFNGGPRICLGQQFALNEASFVIVRILQKFKDIEAGFEGAIVPDPLQHTQLTMSVEGGVNLRLIPADC